MKKIFLAGLFAAVSTIGAYALDEELMIVTLKDGSTVEYNVENVERVNFENRHTEEAFTVTSDGHTASYPSIPVMLRVKAAETGAATQFGFGTVSATDASGLVDGEYGMYLKVSALKIYAGDIDLATETESYSMRLIKYADGQAEEILEAVTSGRLTTKINNKNNQVTINLEATFDNGTVVTANYVGRPADVESLDAMIPAKQYGNEMFYYDSSQNEFNAKITDVYKSYSSYSGKTTLRFSLDDYLNGEEEVRIVFTDELFKSTQGTFNLAETAGWELRLGGFQLSGYDENDPNSNYKNCADNGTMKFINNADGTIELFIEVQNYYNNYMGTHLGTPEKVIFNYVGSIE